MDHWTTPPLDHRSKSGANKQTENQARNFDKNLKESESEVASQSNFVEVLLSLQNLLSNHFFHMTLMFNENVFCKERECQIYNTAKMEQHEFETVKTSDFIFGDSYL